LFAGLALAVVLGLYGLVRLSKARFRPDSGAPVFGGALTRLAPAGGVVEQRYQGMMKDRNLYDAARIAAQHFFAVSLPSPGLGNGTPERTPALNAPPRVVAKGGWLRRRRHRRFVRILWRLAHDPTPRRIAPDRFAQLLAKLKTLKAALVAGDLRLERIDHPVSKRGQDS
jgi:hypothetical protein